MTDAKRWWCAYEDGTVWPCEIVTVTPFGVTVLPVHPAPDAGTEKTVPRHWTYDSKFKHPTFADATGRSR